MYKKQMDGQLSLLDDEEEATAYTLFKDQNIVYSSKGFMWIEAIRWSCICTQPSMGRVPNLRGSSPSKLELPEVIQFLVRQEFQIKYVTNRMSSQYSTQNSKTNPWKICSWNLHNITEGYLVLGKNNG